MPYDPDADRGGCPEYGNVWFDLQGGCFKGGGLIEDDPGGQGGNIELNSPCCGRFLYGAPGRCTECIPYFFSDCNCIQPP